MERVFISSLARGEMAGIRKAARRAVEALDMRPIMFETEPANQEGPRRALLDRVGGCDALLLIIGAEYGEPGVRGKSPTEEEFDEALERGVPVLVLVQGVEREPAQAEFLARVRGSWEDGSFTSNFATESDVPFGVTATLNSLRTASAGTEARSATQTRAQELAQGNERSGQMYGGSKLRVVVAPVTGHPLLDAVSLRDPDLNDDLIAAARASRLVSQSDAIETRVLETEIELKVSGGHYEQLTLRVGFDGCVVGEGAVGGDQMAFGSSMVMARRAREVIQRSLAFASAVWDRIDARDEIREAYVACAVPEAEHKVYALEEIGNTMSMPMGSPHTLVVPESPLQSRRADLPTIVDRLEAELHRSFEVHGAVHPPG